jgi:hypothetical protein
VWSGICARLNEAPPFQTTLHAKALIVLAAKLKKDSQELNMQRWSKRRKMENAVLKDAWVFGGV